MDNGAISKSAKKRIIILGGGFGGVYAALHLERLLAREPEVEICLVSRDNFFLFTPMLHEIAASDLEITNINFSGFFAWWLWRTIYLSKLPGLDKKVRVAFAWTLDLLFRKDVCAVHDLPSHADFHHREHRWATVDNGQYQRTTEVAATLERVNP